MTKIQRNKKIKVVNSKDIFGNIKYIQWYNGILK